MCFLPVRFVFFLFFPPVRLFFLTAGNTKENELWWKGGKVINFSTENNCMELINEVIKNMLVCLRDENLFSSSF
jgi:hypothetical protein